MQDKHKGYLLRGTDMFHVRNRNEVRVIEEMIAYLAEHFLEPGEEELRDVYAYALNQLPARYAQQGTIILRDPVKKDSVKNMVQEAFNVVLNNPKA